MKVLRYKLSKKKVAQARLERAEHNPIILPDPDNEWEAWQTFNPGVILLEDKVHFMYRAIGDDGVSRMGYAASRDGVIIDTRLPYPVYEHKISNPTFNCHSFASGCGFAGAEDPRIVQVDEEDRLYMTYTACDTGLRVGLTSIGKDDFLQKRWRWTPAKLISSPNEIHKNWVIFPDKINGRYAILTSICPEISIAYRDNLDFEENEYIPSHFDPNYRRKKGWDRWIRGAGAPPLKTDRGWLLFYHAMDHNDPGKYKVGAMLLDLNDPTKILFRAPKPVLSPEKEYENNGFKAGVVYVCGALIKNDRLMVYYGAADSYVSVAYANIQEFLGALTSRGKPKLKRKTT